MLSHQESLSYGMGVELYTYNYIIPLMKYAVISKWYVCTTYIVDKIQLQI